MSDSPRVFVWAIAIGPLDSGGGSVLRTPVWYLVYRWYVSGSRLGAPIGKPLAIVSEVVKVAPHIDQICSREFLNSWIAQFCHTAD